MNQIRIADLPWEERRSPSGKFQSFCRDLSLALGGIRNVGTWGGGHPFDLQIRRVPPGAAICPFHLHLAQWELYVILAGEATVRAGDGSYAAGTAEVFVHPPGEPHQLTNAGSADLEVLIVADNQPLDVCYYPDSDKWCLRPPIKFYRMTEVDYLDGEEPEPAATAPRYRPVTAPLPAPATPFAARKLHPDSLPWEDWFSPKGKFHGTGKSLSIALGAKANTPPGLGGHPFDLELGKLAPGECGCPYHSHAAQWELYVFLSGTGTVRTAAGNTAVAAGDVVLHPPREEHMFTNTGGADLLYYLVADNPPVDYWHYPDSGKWGLREPRMIFRPAEADYWDGEE